MKHFFFALAACALSLSGPSHAATLAPCVAGPLSSYIGVDCDMGGGFIAKDFFFQAVDLNPSDPTLLATAADIWILPLETGKGFGFSSSFFDIKGYQHVAYAFNYLIDPPPPIIPGFEFFLDSFSPVAPGYATVTSDICVGGSFVKPFNINLILSGSPLDENGCESGIPYPNTFRLQVFDNGSPSDKKLFEKVIFTAPTNIVDVRTVLEMNANGESSQITGFGTRAIIAPEPGSIALAAAGLFALAYLGRRRR